MPWEKTKLRGVADLVDQLRDLKSALEDKRVDEVKKLQTVLSLYDSRLQEKLKEAVNAGKVEQP
tara:strand:- start:270 stop:461 length:192 start_codon:yes stop_codon:yes gene_type:complete